MYGELVKVLRRCVLSEPCEGCPYYDPHGPTEKCATLNIAAADAIEELICEVADEHNARLDAEERQHWIPVAERLPDFDGAVLCMRKSNVYGVRPYQEILYVDEYGFTNYDDIYLADGVVTHWMPLPEPPKEE